VRYKVWESRALYTYDRAGLSRQQRAFIEGLLRSLEAGTYLSEHVASASSAVLALTRAHHVLDEHSRTGQPHIGLTRTVLSQALTDVASGVPAYSTTATGTAVITQAHQTLLQVHTRMTGSPSSTDKQQFANQVSALVQPAADAVRSMFEVIWSIGGLSAEVANRIRDEVAVLTVLEGRDGVACQVDLLRLFGRGVVDVGVIDAAAVARVLWPPSTQYRVAMVVSGTRVLEGLELLLPDALQWPLAGQDPPAGSPYREIRRLIDPAFTRAGSSMLIVLPVLASDAYTAIAQARRSLVETLDQYAAGQRLLEQTIDPRSIALSASSSPVMTDPRTGGSKAARPLTSHWPVPLRSALRMANLAGRMDAPVASVTLAWGAIESLGVRREDFELVAKVCALHSLRQQILSVYKSVTDSSNARLHLGRWRVNLVRANLEKVERSYAAAVRGSSAAAKEAAARLKDTMAQVRKQVAEAESDYAHVEQRLLPSIEIIRQNLLRGGVRGHPLDMGSWLLNLNEFLDSILPLDTNASVDLRNTQDAIVALAREAGGLAEEQLITWQRRLSYPPALADWLNRQQATFQGLLAWMYASRNLAIHSGRFFVPADVLTAQAGRGIVDMILEFLGHWYQNQRSSGVPDSDARVVLQELADRKDALDRQLRRAASCHPLNIVTITAPGGDPWRRL
jgi:hypothetical protein